MASTDCIVGKESDVNTGVLHVRVLCGLRGDCSRSSLSRISALGVDGEARASSLKVLGKVVLSFSGLQDQSNSYTTKTLHFRRLFSIMPARGISTRIRVKYRIDASWPIMMNGCSTG